MTVAQLFLGGLSMLVGFSRGTNAYAGFFHEEAVAVANDGASKQGQDHARASNIHANDNIAMTAMLGPRFSIEADLITMAINAVIACAECPEGEDCHICGEVAVGLPRVLGKLIWTKLKEELLGAAVGKITETLDKLASLQVEKLVIEGLKKTPSGGADLSVRFEDPSRQGTPWSVDTMGVASKLAVTDALGSQMPGHAFPVVVTENLLEGLPELIVKALGMVVSEAMSQATSDACNASPPSAKEPVGFRFPQIPELRKRAENECKAFRAQMSCALSSAKGGSCGDANQDFVNLSAEERKSLVFSRDVESFMTCQEATLKNPLKIGAGGFTVRKNGKLLSCSFDEGRCLDKRLENASREFLMEKLGLPKTPTVKDIERGFGGLTHGANKQNLWSCSYVKKQVDPRVLHISRAACLIGTFGTGECTDPMLQSPPEYASCSRVYFPNKKGMCSSVSEDEQGFSPCWKFAMVGATP